MPMETCNDAPISIIIEIIPLSEKRKKAGYGLSVMGRDNARLDPVLETELQESIVPLIQVPVDAGFVEEVPGRGLVSEQDLPAEPLQHGSPVG